jgi:peptidoglycan lytic transglycosylase
LSFKIIKCENSGFPAISKIFLVFVLISITFSLNAQTTTKSHKELLAEAASLYKSGAYSKSIIKCMEVEKTSSDHTIRGRALYLAGHCQYKLKDYKTARLSFRKASAFNPGLSFHGLYYAAMTHKDKREFDKSINFLEQLLSNSPPGDLKGKTMIELMRCHRKAGAHVETKTALGRVNAYSAKDSSWNRELDYTKGWVQFKQDGFAAARETFTKLWRDHPKSYWADQAKEMLSGTDKAKFLLPGEKEIFNEGDRIKRIKNLIKSRRASKAILELDPIIANAEKFSSSSRTAGLYKIKGEAQMKKRAYSTAIKTYEKAQALDPKEDHEITYQIASCHHRSGSYTEAIKEYLGLWTRFPKGTYATRCLFYSARLKKLKNDWSGAEKEYRKLANDYPGSTLRAEALFQLAWIKYLKGDYVKAGLYLDQVPKKSKDKEFNARTLYWKSVILRKQGDHPQAVEIEDKILTKHWRSPYSFYLVVMDGVTWPYVESTITIPKSTDKPPLEYNIALELFSIGQEEDAKGQLNSLQKQGKMPQWLAWKVMEMYRGLDDHYYSQRTARKNFSKKLNNPPPGQVQAWQASYPKAYEEWVLHYSKKNKVDPYLVWSLMRAESTYRPKIKSGAGAVGLMQIMPATGKQIAGGLKESGYSKSLLENPETNIRFGTYYLSGRLKQFGGTGDNKEAWLKTVTRSLAAYNAGPTRSERWSKRTDGLGLPAAAFVEEIPIKETREYVKRILGFYLVYLTSYPRDTSTVDAKTFEAPKTLTP